MMELNGDVNGCNDWLSIEFRLASLCLTTADQSGYSLHHNVT
jgi:hypothetical protein